MQPKCERRLIHTGAKFDFEAVSLTLPDGSVVSRDVVRHPGAVCIVPVLDDGRLLLIRNLRVATAGSALLRPAGTFLTSPGLSDEEMHAFVATSLAPVGQRLQPDERIEVHPTPLKTVLAMLDASPTSSDRLMDAKSMLALLLAMRKNLIQ